MDIFYTKYLALKCTICYILHIKAIKSPSLLTRVRSCSRKLSKQRKINTLGKKMSFKEWYDNADMPEKDSKGKWIDRETGIYYEPENNFTSRSKVSSKTAEIRKEIKKFGCSALKGTLKQKEWAEKIRIEFFKKFSDELKEFYATLDKAQYAAMWIAMKDNSIQSFENNMKEFYKSNEEIKKLNLQAASLKDSRGIYSDREKIMSIRQEINEIHNNCNKLFYSVAD